MLFILPKTSNFIAAYTPASDLKDTRKMLPNVNELRCNIACGNGLAAHR